MSNVQLTTKLTQGLADYLDSLAYDQIHPMSDDWVTADGYL